MVINRGRSFGRTGCGGGGTKGVSCGLAKGGCRCRGRGCLPRQRCRGTMSYFAGGGICTECGFGLGGSGGRGGEVGDSAFGVAPAGAEDNGGGGGGSSSRSGSSGSDGGLGAGSSFQPGMSMAKIVIVLGNWFHGICWSSGIA